MRYIWLVCGISWLSAVTEIPAQESLNTISFPAPFDTEPASSGKPLPPEEAAARFRRPPGFRVTVFAAEPDVCNPIGMAWDGRGRLWVAENYTYADRETVFDFSLRDRVLIFEDTDNDGVHDRRTIFTDEVQLLTSVEVGLGGAWLMTPPQLIFIPDLNRDDRPDSAPIVVLDGFTPSRDNYHTFANGLRWGPDGWLYGRCGASSPGRIGAPGTPDDQRIPLHGGIWRFHPVRKIFEVVSHGTTNPWGLDWNATGDGMFVNTVNGHLWQLIPGAHYKRPHSEDPNPYVYETIDTHADHYHWDTGKHWTDSRNPVGEHDRLGGGHAHSGCLIYNGQNWPAEYWGALLTLNLHGRRVNVERLDHHGTAVLGKHQPDILQSADPWFRGIDLSCGPDGSVFILDWSDSGECHDTTGIHRSSGRIFKVSYGQPQLTKTRHIGQLSLAELVRSALLPYDNQADRYFYWHAKQARLELATRVQLHQQYPEVKRQLRSLWNGDRVANEDPLNEFSVHEIDKRIELAQAIGVISHQEFTEWYAAPGNRFYRANARFIDLLLESSPIDTILSQRPTGESTNSVLPNAVMDILKEVALNQINDSNRLALASGLQRLPLERRLEFAQLLEEHALPDDHNLPLMIWYGLIPVAESHPREMAEYAINTLYPTTRQLITRRLTEMIESHPERIELLLAKLLLIEDHQRREKLLPDILHGMSEACAGRQKLQVPQLWEGVSRLAKESPQSELVSIARELDLLFGDGRALDEIKQIVRDEQADIAIRKRALQSLIERRPDDLREICEAALTVRSLNTVAVGGLTGIEDSQLAHRLARSYRTFLPAERPSLIDALTTRPTFASALIDEVREGHIPHAALTPVHARQILSFENAELSRQLNEVWGEIRHTPAEKVTMIDSLKHQLTTETLAQADPAQGRVVYQKVCSTCHRLYGHGASIGPDLTGSGRANLDYLLQNLVDPSATVGAEYRMTVVVLKDGRVLNGIVTARQDNTMTLQTTQDRMIIEWDEIETTKLSSVSLMPDGQLQTLTAAQIRDLVGYLMHPVQVPLPDGESPSAPAPSR